jgi:transposase
MLVNRHYIVDIQCNTRLSLDKNYNMPKGKSSKITFKAYHQNQIFLLPPSFDDLIPQNHLVRTLNETIDQLNIDPLLKSYKGGGASIYHPKMMIKVLNYAYLNKIYTSRKIAKALREDVNFMWLSGMNRPDYRTINIFRSSRLKPVMDEVFASMVLFCQTNGYITLENYFVDGTKMEANASKNSYVWSKNTKRYKGNVTEKIKQLLAHIDELNDNENHHYGDRDLEELGEGVSISSEKIKEQAQKINATIVAKKAEQSLDSVDKEVAKAVKQIEKQLPKLEQYEEQEKILAGRNSYSKTDPDATFHRLKNDLLRPSYNTLIGCENQFIVNYTIHQNPGESGLFIEHIENLKRLTGSIPKNAIGDSAFGSEENYDYLAKNGIENYLKYNTFHFDETQKQDRNKFSKDKFKYDNTSDSYTCPGSRSLKFKALKETKTDNGYVSHVRIYECEDCKGCAFSQECKKGAGNRSLQINPQLDRYRKAAFKNLTSAKGIELRKQRNTEPETVFGDIKWNSDYTRFILRGKEKVKTEMGLLSIAHNIKKIFQMKSLDQANSSINQIKFSNPLSTGASFYFCSVRPCNFEKTKQEFITYS